MRACLDDRVIAVTGAANSFGSAVTRALAASRAKVGQTSDVDAADVQGTAKGLPDDLSADTQLGDVSDPATPHAIASVIFEQFGRTDGLVNVAGITTCTNCSKADWENVFVDNTRASRALINSELEVRLVDFVSNVDYAPLTGVLIDREHYVNGAPK